MKKSELTSEVVRRTGLPQQTASRGIEETIRIIEREISESNDFLIDILGRLLLKSEKGPLPPAEGTPPTPVPEELAVKSVVTRKAMSGFNAATAKSSRKRTNSGGKMAKQHDNENSSGESTSKGDWAMGLDVGTSRVVLATGTAERSKAVDELNAFITLPFSKLTEKIFKDKNVPYQIEGGSSLQVYGNEAARFAKVFNIEVRRPMSGGTINPAEDQSLGVLNSIIEHLLGKGHKGASLRFSVPGELRGGESSDLVYHEAMLKKTLEAMGYNATSINEGLAVVFSELEEENFTGIGISCGGGMCNVAVAFMSMPVLTFSTGKAGDYIDRSVSSVTKETANSVRMIKEKGLDLSRAPQNKYEEAFQTYYDEVINTLVSELRDALAETKNLPSLDESMPIVLSGGTAKPKGFDKKFLEAIERNDFPLKISEVRMARDPLTGTARGCLIAAMYDA
jgi:actin-like ATPase involved in cell morphogenesis